MAAYPYRKTIRHEGLGKSRNLSAATAEELQWKVDAQLKKWDAEWKALTADRLAAAAAHEISKKSEDLYEQLTHVLANALQKTYKLDFEKLKSKAPFSVAMPAPKPYIPLLRQPLRTDEKYNPPVPVLCKMSKRKMDEFVRSNDRVFAGDMFMWNNHHNKVKAQNEQISRENIEAQKTWEAQRANYFEKQKQHNEKVDRFRERFLSGEKKAIEQYFSILLKTQTYPIEFDHSCEIEYDPEEKRIVVDIGLPVLDDIPSVKSASFQKTKHDLKKTEYSEKERKQIYDLFVYQVVLKTLYILFYNQYDHLQIEYVALNGMVHTIDKATGKDINPYILSVNVKRADFLDLNLSAVDPRAWFKRAKGVSAASLAEITPVAPIVSLNKFDKRFVDGYSVIDAVDDSINLAAMDWQDFENLVREIFEEEFRANGGEVHITQASRDGGVDAVAFDPDPIRGGKIVIQAKRYTNVVGVSAVRDLYGTVINEGATKGILVTTSNFGNDAYEFIKDKPLTLMNGAQLLGLLQTHGHKARINLKEAKDLLNT